jgi:Uma2 family endonuclease
MAVEYRTEPDYIEELDGRRYPKVSPRRQHALVQGAIGRVVHLCVGDRGFVGPEWKFRIGMVDGTQTALIPDIAYISFERLQSLAPNDREEPPVGPDLAIEVRSPSGRKKFLASKIARYLACGTLLVLDIDPEARTIVGHAADGIRHFAETDRFEHPAMPWLTFAVADLFRDLDRLK